MKIYTDLRGKAILVNGNAIVVPHIILPWNITEVDYLLQDGQTVTIGSNYVPVIDVENRAGLYNISTESIEYPTGSEYEAHFVNGANDYTVVKAITTSGQQNNQTNTKGAAYIDTGIIPKTANKTKTKTRMYFSNTVSGTSNEALCGTTGSGRYAWGYANLNPKTDFYMGLGAQNYATGITRDTNWHIFELDSENNTWTIDSSTGTFTSAGTLNATISIYLFARNSISYTGGQANKPVNGGCSWHKTWEDDVMTQNLIAVKDSTGAFMWDTVTKTTFKSIGDGTKTFGYTA